MLLDEWLKSKRHTFDPRVMLQKEIVNLFVPKIEMNRIEWKVAEFEIKMAQELLCIVVDVPTSLLLKKEKGTLSSVGSMTNGSRAVGKSYREASSSPTTTTATPTMALPMVAKSATGEEDTLPQDQEPPSQPIPSIVKSSISNNTGEDNTKEETKMSHPSDYDDARDKKSPHVVALDALLMAAERMETREENSLPRKV